MFEVDRQKGIMLLTELAPGVEVEEVRRKTAASFEIADEVKVMD